MVQVAFQRRFMQSVIDVCVLLSLVQTYLFARRSDPELQTVWFLLGWIFLLLFTCEVGLKLWAFFFLSELHTSVRQLIHAIKS